MGELRGNLGSEGLKPVWRKWSKKWGKCPGPETYRNLLVSGIRRQADRVWVQDSEQKGGSDGEP